MEELLFKAEKPNAVRRYNNVLDAVSKTLRLLELCALILLLSWLLTRLPFALQFLRTLFALAASPLFVFALSNAIIAALLAHAPPSAPPLFLNPPDPHAPPPEDTHFHDKQVISETLHDRPTYHRTHSQKTPGNAPPRRRQLRRAETDTQKRRQNSPQILYPQDKLSNEEFQRAIEAFIAKQLRFLREESSSAIVLQNPS
uniref:DUF4408 domain-containing protein n=1 Tax=Cajanus cajan TaxID=3821 RepID=A0A151R2J9_CAJCA|nr:hypothetical protein KK1_042035 [Cajanus cajan]